MKISALLLSSALLLAACGGGGTANTAATTSSTTASTALAASAADTASPAPAAGTGTATTTSATAAGTAATSGTASSIGSSTTSGTTSSTGSTAPSASAPPSTSASTGTGTGTAAPTLVEYYGDSIVWGWLPNNDWVRVDSPEPAVFAADTKFNVANMGSPGRLAEHALAGDAVYPAWTTQMAQSKASHVIIEYHSHDTVANTTARVRQLIQIAKAAGKKVIVETIGPGNHDGNLSYQQISQAQRDAAAAEGVPVIDQTVYLDKYLASSGKTVWDICADGLHPNPDIYIMKGHYAATQFATLK